MVSVSKPHKSITMDGLSNHSFPGPIKDDDFKNHPHKLFFVSFTNAKEIAIDR